MDPKRLLITLVLAGIASLPLAAQELLGPSEVLLETTLHFPTRDGGSASLPGGRYLVVGEHGGLTLTPLDGGAEGPIAIDAMDLEHDEDVAEPSAFVMPAEAGDARHLVLLLPEGEGLEAVGTPGEVATRGALRISRPRVATGMQRVRQQAMERIQVVEKPTGVAPARVLPFKPRLIILDDAPMVAVSPSALRFAPLAFVANAPKLELALEPMEGDALVYHPTAGWTAQGRQQAQLSVLVYVRNKESKTVTLEKVAFEYGNNVRNFPLESPGIAIAPDQRVSWQNSRPYHEYGQVLYFDGTVPSSIRIELFFKEFAAPGSITAKLTPYARSFDLPFRIADLRTDEVWESASTHGGGAQVFAYDMGVEIPGQGGLLPNKDTSANANYRIFGKPIYAMADGVVKGFNNQVPNNPRPCTSEASCVEGQDQASWSDHEHGGAGNHFYIQHGDVIALYAHMQKGSLSSQLQRVGAVVRKGVRLGLAGNSGSSGGPHLHVHLRKESAIETGPFRPLLFNRGFTIGKQHYPSPSSNIHWSPLAGLAIPGAAGTRSYVHPEKHPYCDYPTNWGEVGKHGIPDARYQQEFDKISTCGYALKWVDGYDVSGRTYFNVIFSKSNAPWVARHNMSGSRYQTEFDKWSKAGFRLVNVDSYLRGSEVNYAAVWEKSSGPAWTAYHGRARSAHQSSFEDLSGKGYVPVNVSVAKGRVTALYEKRSTGGFYLKSAMTLGEYKTLFKQYGDRGFELVYLNGYREDGTPRLSGIWYRNAPFSTYFAKHHLSAGDYQKEYASYLQQGFATRVVTGYEDAGHRFEGIWTK